MLIFQRESASSVLKDIIPLAIAHDLEVQDEIAAEFPLEIKPEAYERLEALNLLRVFTARDEDKLAGYGIYIRCPSLRRKGLTIAMEEALYFCPEYRRAGNAIRFIHYVEEQLKLECQVITYHSPTVNPVLGKVLERIGYTKHSEYFTRRI